MFEIRQDDSKNAYVKTAVWFEFMGKGKWVSLAGVNLDAGWHSDKGFYVRIGNEIIQHFATMQEAENRLQEIVNLLEIIRKETTVYLDELE